MQIQHSFILRSNQLSIIGTVVFIFFISCTDKKYTDPLSPEASMATFELDENFEVEIFASEPFVQDPVEMVFDEKGNIYVVEMPDYPFQPEGDEGSGRIKKLFDRDGDGRIDEAIVFAEGIKDATSMQVWKEGLLVTAAPYILYLKDMDGDHVADVQKVLFEGFFNNNQEAQITNLRFNVDNWIYAANHGQAGSVRFNRQPEAEPLDTRGSDFRFRLDKNLFENETGTAQFGQALNNWGHRFITHNTTHIRQTVMPWRYLHRHKHLPTTQGALNISDHELVMFQLSNAPYWRVERSNRRQKKYDAQNLNRVEHIDSHFTGASGGTHYGADLFPEDYRGNIFTGDVMGNLVHRDVVTMPQDRSVYTASRANSDRHKEFLASTDEWFRPDNFTVGPDGSLYVIDMYRQHIETPLSIPEDLKEEMDFMRGEDMGRIYRVVPRGHSSGIIPENLMKEHNSGTYLEWLSHPNQWYRLNGQRLLLEQQDRSVLPELQSILREDSDPLARLHAFYVLEGMEALNVDLVNAALTDRSPGVREHALMVAESFPECISNMIALTHDPYARVVFQAALSLGSFSDNEKVIPALADILQKHYDDQWIRMGVWSSEVGSSASLISYLVSSTKFMKESDGEKENMIQELGLVIGSRGDTKESIQFISICEKLPSLMLIKGIQGLAMGVKKSEKELHPQVYNKLQSLLAGGSASMQEALQDII